MIFLSQFWLDNRCVWKTGEIKAKISSKTTCPHGILLFTNLENSKLLRRGFVYCAMEIVSMDTNPSGRIPTVTDLAFRKYTLRTESALKAVIATEFDEILFGNQHLWLVKISIRRHQFSLLGFKILIR